MFYVQGYCLTLLSFFIGLGQCLMFLISNLKMIFLRKNIFFEKCNKTLSSAEVRFQAGDIDN